MYTVAPAAEENKKIIDFTPLLLREKGMRAGLRSA
jgi:hypothetical protein